MNSSKQLLYIANLRLPTERAYGIQIAKMCEAFGVLGLDVELVAPYRINKIKDAFFDYYGVKKVFRFKKTISPDFYLPGKLNIFAFWLKNSISAIILSIYAVIRKPDIIYSRDELPLFLLSFFRENLIYEAHRFSKSKKLFYRRFENRNLKVVVITKRLEEDFIKIGFKPENILVVPDGVDLAEFDVDISKEEARVRVGLPLDRKIVMYTGHLFEWKGAGMLLETARNFQFSTRKVPWGTSGLLYGISNFQNNIDDVLFVFVGGTEYDKKKFREKARGLNNVLILGHKPHKEIPIYLKAADVLVLPNSAKEEISRSYTSPLKLFEYMASGRPTIASDLPSIKEVLNQNNSLLVKPDDSQQLTEAIERVVNNLAMSNQLAQKAREGVENYTWAKRADKILSFIG